MSSPRKRRERGGTYAFPDDGPCGTGLSRERRGRRLAGTSIGRGRPGLSRERVGGGGNDHDGHDGRVHGGAIPADAGAALIRGAELAMSRLFFAVGLRDRPY